MDDVQAPQGSRQDPLSHVDAVSPPVPDSGSSPLSEICSEYAPEAVAASRKIEHVTDRDFAGDESQVPGGDTSSLSSPQATPAEEGSGSDENADLSDLQCRHCKKTFVHDKSLKRHLIDKKTNCYKSRGIVDDEPKWGCTRCHAAMSKRYSVERHIKESCWKICDECIESDSTVCDASLSDGDCTTCAKAGKSCTKHQERVPGTVSELLTEAAEVNNAELRVRTATNALANIQRAKRNKRKAAGSPDASPQVKARPRRKSRAVKKEDATARRSIGEAQGDDQSEELDHGSMVNASGGTPHHHHLQTPVVPSQPLHGHPTILERTLLPPFEPNTQNSRHAFQHQHQDYSPLGYGLGIDMTGHHPSRMPPPASNMGTSHGTLYDPAMLASLQNQDQALRNMTMAAQYGSRYGIGLPQSAPESALRTSLHTGPNSWGQQQPRPLAHVNARESLASNFSIHQGRRFDQVNGANPLFSFERSAPDSRGPSRRSSTADFDNAGGCYMLPNFSASNSRAPSRHSSIAGGQLSAPGSRVQSRRPSRQSSLERSAAHHEGQPGQAVARNHENDRGRLMVRLPMPRELKIQLTLKAPNETIDDTFRPLCLRIHSNTFDGNGAPIFSILSILPTEIFGPRLDYYCQARGKRFNVDYKIIYKYPAPTPGNPNRKRYFDITWNVTPAKLADKEYPGSAIKDGDTLWVVHRRTPIAPDADELGTQPEAQRVHIQHGETKVWQNPDVNATWYMNAEKTLSAARNEIGALQNELKRQAQHAQQLQAQLQQYAMRNTQFANENRALKTRMAQQAPMMPMNYGHMPMMPQQNDPHMQAYRARAMAQQNMGLHSVQGQPAMYATASHGDHAYNGLPHALPSMGTFHAQDIRGQGALRRLEPAPEITVKDAPDEDEEYEE